MANPTVICKHCEKIQTHIPDYMIIPEELEVEGLVKVLCTDCAADIIAQEQEEYEQEIKQASLENSAQAGNLRERIRSHDPLISAPIFEKQRQPMPLVRVVKKEEGD